VAQPWFLKGRGQKKNIQKHIFFTITYTYIFVYNILSKKYVYQNEQFQCYQCNYISFYGFKLITIFCFLTTHKLLCPIVLSLKCSSKLIFIPRNTDKILIFESIKTNTAKNIINVFFISNIRPVWVGMAPVTSPPLGYAIAHVYSS